MVAERQHNNGADGRLRRGTRGRYAPPPQLFPVAVTDALAATDGRLSLERDAEGAYLVRQRDTGRLIARTADSATLQRLLTTLARA